MSAALRRSAGLGLLGASRLGLGLVLAQRPAVLAGSGASRATRFLAIARTLPRIPTTRTTTTIIRTSANPAAAAAAHPWLARSHSSLPPKEQDEETKKKEKGGQVEEEEARRLGLAPLPKDWLRPSEQDMVHFKEAAARLVGNSWLLPLGNADHLRKYGIPPELKDLVFGNPSGDQLDWKRVTGVALGALKLANRAREWEGMSEEQQAIEWNKAEANTTSILEAKASAESAGKKAGSTEADKRSEAEQQTGPSNEQPQSPQPQEQPGQQADKKSQDPEASARDEKTEDEGQEPASAPGQGKQPPSPPNRDAKQPGPAAGPGGRGGDSNNSGNNNSGSRWYKISMAEIIGSVVALLIIESLFVGTSREITWQEVRRNFLDKGLVKSFTVQKGGVVDVQLTEGADDATGGQRRYFFTIGSVESFEKQLEAAQDELAIPPSERIPVTYSGSSSLWQLLLAFGPTLLLIGLLGWGTRSLGSRGGNQSIFSMGKTKAKIYSESGVKIRFADVAGMEEAKVEIMEFVSFLKNPEKFERLGAKIPRGAILSGPPGTGKTLLAKATAGESGVPFYSVSGSEFVEMFVGVGASRVRDLFANARKNSPCIIFIDEIDAIGRSRRGDRGGYGGNDEREATLNQILTEMDGFNTTEQVVVLAGTNRADVLDKALMRPGRFDRHIYIDRPTMIGRQAIFRVHLKKIVTNEDMDHLVGRLASMTPGFSGADVANVVNEAALIAARADASSVAVKHFEQAIERVVGGLERKSLVLKPKEKRVVAYHEAGHAICGWYLEHADPLLKVSIIPRGQNSLGYAQYLPGDAYLMTAHQLTDRMAMALGGRVSEELNFETVTTGASDDFNKVTHMARQMVTQWGMSDKVGPIYFDNDPNRLQRPFAESTAQTIDAEVHRIIDAAYSRCRQLLTDRKKEVELVAEELLKKEMLTRDDIVRLLGRREWGNDAEFEKYFGGGGDNGGSGGSAEGGATEAPPPIPPEREEGAVDKPEGPTPSPAFWREGR